MKLQKILGIAFVVAAAIIMPFGHWLNKVYYVVGILAAIIGGIFLSKFLLKKSWDDTTSDHPPAIGDAAGFHGAHNTHDSPSADDGIDDFD